MTSITSTRIYPGYTRYGDPLMVALWLSHPVTATSDSALAEAQRELRNLGPVIPPNGIDTRGDRAARREALLAAGILRALLQEVGHASDRVVVEPLSGSETKLVVPCEETMTCLYAGELACMLLDAALRGEDMGWWRPELEAFQACARAHAIDPNSRLLAQAARQRGLPVRWLDQTPFGEAPEDHLIRFGLLQVGHGSNSRVLIGPMPRAANMQTLLQANDRSSLMPLLARAGIPIPPQDFQFANRGTAGRARRSAERLGYPVTLKSLAREEFPHRQAALKVYGPLFDARQVETAFEAAARPIRKVWVEGYPEGARYRFIVVGGQVRAVSRRAPPAIVGDGTASVDELIAQCTREARGPEAAAAWSAIRAGDADTELRLKLAGLDRDSVLAAGQRVELRSEGTPWNGGHCEDATDTVAPAIRDVAEQAARACGLHELAGVDMAVQDPAGSATATNCAVLEVLADPDLVTHTDPRDGTPCDVADELLGTLFPPGATGRIPLAAVTGTNGKTTTTRMIAHILRQQFRHVGIATTSGAWVNEELFREGDSAGVTGAASVLAVEHTEAAVLETARGGLIKLGGGFDRCDVGLCLNVTSDHLGRDGVDTLDQMAEVKSDVIRRTQGSAVLNADDTRVLAMRTVTPARDLILVSRTTPAADLVARYPARAVAIESVEGEPWIVACDAGTRTPVMPVGAIPATLDGAVAFNVDNAAFAVAGAWAMGMPFTAIREALGSFHASYECNPGRFNVIDLLPFRVVIDFAHNAEGMRMLNDALRALPKPRRRLLLLRTAEPLRSLEEIRDFARAAAAARFDVYICARRGKSETDVPTLLRDTLLEQGIPEPSVRVIPESTEAIDAMLEMAEPDDLLVMLGGKRTGMIIDRLHALAEARETEPGTLPQAPGEGHSEPFTPSQRHSDPESHSA